MLPSLAALSACMVGPDFEKPEFDSPAAWNGAKDSGVLAQNPKGYSQRDLVEWWRLFGDDVLCGLIDEAVAKNFSLETARAKVEQARATLGIHRSGLWPSLDADASFKEGAKPLTSSTSESYKAGATAAWEIDVFGGTRRSIESAADGRAIWTVREAARAQIPSKERAKSCKKPPKPLQKPLKKH